MADILASVSVQLGANISAFKAGMADARRELRGLVQTSEGLKDIGGSLTKFTTLPLLAVGGAAVKMAGDMEKAQASFKTMLGSASAATSTLADLKQFAADTPFEFPEIQSAAKKLLAFNTPAKDLKETLRELGDVSSGIDAPIGEIADLFGKARVQGRLFQEDINQLTGRGIPIIQELAKQFGVTEDKVRDLVTSGKVNFSNLQQAFADLTKEGGRFGGLMAEQSTTIPGLFSTLSDNAGQALAGLGADLAQEFNLKGVVTQLSAFVKSAADAFKDLSPAAKSGVLGLAGFTAAAGPVLYAIGQVGTALPGLRAAFKLVGIEGAASLGPILPVAAAVAAAAYLIYDNWDEIRAYFTTGEGGRLFKELAASVSQSIGEIRVAIDSLKGIGSGSFGELISASNVAKTAVRELAVGFTALSDVVGGTIGFINQLLKGDLVAAEQEAERALYGLIDPLANLFGLVKTKQASFSEFFKEVLPAARGAAGGVDYFSDSLTGAGNQAKQASGLLAALEAQLKALQDARPNLTTEAGLADNTQQIAAVQAQIDRLNALGKANTEMAKAYAEVQKTFRQIGSESQALGQQFEYLEARQAADQAGIKRLIDAGYSPFSSAVQKLVGDLRNLNVTLGDNTQLTTRVADVVKNAFSAATPEFKLQLPQVTGLEEESVLPDYKSMFAVAAQDVAQGNGALVRAFQPVSQAQLDFNTNMEQLLDAFPAQAFATIGQSIADGIAGGADALDAVGQGLLKTLAQFLSEYGRLVLLKGAADIALGNIGQGIAELAAGAALTALGGFANSASSSKASSTTSSRASASPASTTRTYATTTAPTGAAAGAATYKHYVQIVADGRDLRNTLIIETDRLGRIVGG